MASGRRREAIVAAVDMARSRHSRTSSGGCWLGQALIEAALGLNETAEKTRAQAAALLAESGATVPDQRHRAALLQGRLAERLGLAGRGAEHGDRSPRLLRSAFRAAEGGVRRQFRGRAWSSARRSRRPGRANRSSTSGPAGPTRKTRLGSATPWSDLLDDQDDGHPVCADAGRPGRIDLDAPIATYWPASRLAARTASPCAISSPPGRRARLHAARAGLALPGLAGVGGRVAAEPHWFGGERRVIYHGGTYGMIGGELIRRVDGRLPAQFFREEVAAPAGLDFHFGDAQISDPSPHCGVRRPPPASPPPAPPEGLLGRLLVVPPVEGLRTPMTLNPSNNGVATPARSLAAAPYSRAAGYSTAGAYSVGHGRSGLPRAGVRRVPLPRPFQGRPRLRARRPGLHLPVTRRLRVVGAGGSAGWMHPPRLQFRLRTEQFRRAARPTRP